VGGRGGLETYIANYKYARSYIAIYGYYIGEVGSYISI